MSLRVQNDPSSGIGSSEVGRTGQTTSAVSTSGKSRASSGTAGGDQVQVSSVAESIGAGTSALNVQRANRVSQISALYAGGKYTVDSAKVSAALIANATTAIAAGKA
jgi:anti-sigma28 factor (negative regulator of flagellin synthesis)